jgi:hypothetical protein
MSPKKIGKVYGLKSWGRLKKQTKKLSRRLVRRHLKKDNDE